MNGVLVNGHPGDLLSVRDRGLQYGDGLFETLAVVDGRPRLWPQHMQRLRSGCRRLGIPEPDPELLWSEALQLCRGQSQAVLKLILTRGKGGRGYRPPEGVQASRILSLHAWPDYPEAYGQQGVWIRSCRTRLAIQPLLAGLKHLNRLEQVMARREWNDPEIVEGVMCDPFGLVIEGTMSNLFVVRNEVVLTPDLSTCGVAGIMRGQVKQVCEQQGIPLREQEITLDTAREGDEVFLTNSLIGVWPVRRWDDTKYQAPGRLTATIKNTLKESLAV